MTALTPPVISQCDVTYIVGGSGQLAAVLDTHTDPPLAGGLRGQRTVIYNNSHGHHTTIFTVSDYQFNVEIKLKKKEKRKTIFLFTTGDGFEQGS